MANARYQGIPPGSGLGPPGSAPQCGSAWEPRPVALLSGPAGSSPPGRHSARMPEWSHVARRGTNARMAETAHKCNTATLDAVEASIEPWRTAALSEHGDGAKPTPMTGRDCTQVQPSVKVSVKAKAQRQGPALRLSVAPWCRLRGSVASSEHGDGAKRRR